MEFVYLSDYRRTRGAGGISIQPSILRPGRDFSLPHQRRRPLLQGADIAFHFARGAGGIPPPPLTAYAQEQFTPLGELGSLRLRLYQAAPLSRNGPGGLGEPRQPAVCLTHSAARRL